MDLGNEEQGHEHVSEQIRRHLCTNWILYGTIN